MPTRFERHGGPPNLVDDFGNFIRDELGGRSLDDNKDQESALSKFPDFAAFGDRVLIELKHIETDQSDRVNDVFESKIKPEEKPVFYGYRDAAPIIENASNKSEILNALYGKLARTLETQLRKANHQFHDYSQRARRKNAVRLCVFLNSTIQEFGPDAFAYCLTRLIKHRAKSGLEAFPSVDAVLYFSEKHFQDAPGGKAAFPIVLYGLEGLAYARWKELFVETIMDRWSIFRAGSPPLSSKHAPFGVVQDIPEKMARHEWWAIEYERDPYLRHVTNEELRVIFHRNLALSTLGLIKGDWRKPTMEETGRHMRVATHIREEINRRNLDMIFMRPALLSEEERNRVFEGLPQAYRDIVDRK